MKFKRIRFKNISLKLTFVYALLFSCVLLLLSTGILFGIRYYFVQHTFIETQNCSNVTINKILDALYNNQPLTNPNLLNEAIEDSAISIKIADIDGDTISMSNKFDMTGIDITADINTTREIEYTERHLVVQNSAIVIDGSTKAYLQVVNDMEIEYAFLKVVLMTIAIADIVGIIISIFVGYIVSKKMLKPIDKMNRTAKEISICDLHKRIEIGESDDELSRLAKTFNEMIERLELSFEKQNRFVSDASHELRTPIAVIRGYIDLIDRWGKGDEVVLQECVEAIKSETRDMSDLVERLLFLARSDTGQLKINKEEFDLSEIIQELILESNLIAPEQPISSAIKENTFIVADRKLIKQAFRAIIDNSTKYSPNHEEIHISSEIDDEEMRIYVEDSGIGIPPEMIPNIFQRFYRVDSARTRETGGTGLGLPIVELIISANNGEISIESEVGKGTVVCITLPFEQSK